MSADPTTEVPEGTPKQLLRQIEYYFSDANFPKDKFLQAEVAKSEEGWVGLSVIAGFNKVKSLVPDGSIETIASALRYSNFLAVSDDGASVRRPGVVRKAVTLGGLEFNSREEVILYARGLIAEGDAAKDGAISAEGQAFVLGLLDLHDKADEKKGSGVKLVKVGRNPAYPDTSCFVVQRTDDSTVDFSYLKCLDKIYPAPPKSGGGGGSSFGKKRKSDQGGAPADKRAKGADGGPSSAEAEVQYEPGKILVIRDLASGTDRFALADAFGGKDKGCAFVEVVPDMPLAYARFQSAEEAKAALTVEGVGKIALLEGDDEKQYWQKIATGGGGRGGGGKGKGKGGGKGKGKGGRGRGKRH